MDQKLSDKKCVPCEGGAEPLSLEKSQKFLEQVSDWTLKNSKQIEKTHSFKDFKKAMDFVNRVAEIAENEGHHPDISIFNWNKVKITLSTHAIGGLSENDFILASKIDEI